METDTTPPNIIEQTYHSTIESCEWKGTKAVIKRCRNQDDPRSKLRWRNELNALEIAGIHENITQLLASDPVGLAITLRLESGRSLDRHVDSEMKSTLSPSDSDLLWKQMASALAHLHARSITHDDVKPDNIVWSPEQRRAVLIDFGAALNHKVLPPDYFHPSGTPSYAPPEFLLRRKDPKGDIWGLGIVVLFALRHIALPDGEWLLPATFEDGPARHDMLRWLEEINCLQQRLAASSPLVSEMLRENPDARIDSSEL
ncbi:hypothetical protein HK405_009325, partial [Cladochytrium tenue]